MEGIKNEIKEVEIAIYEKEHLCHDMFAAMDWERDSIMREIESPSVALLTDGR